MPIRAKSPCRQAGCRALVDKPGYCDAHKKVEQIAQRSVYRQQRSAMTPDDLENKRFYSRVAWRNVRSLQLQLEPLCRECRKLGKLTAASTVDHIIERSKGGDDYSLENLQSLCKPCHDRKSRREAAKGIGGR
jgi:5-methylcytosine-specific restriction protein A